MNEESPQRCAECGVGEIGNRTRVKWCNDCRKAKPDLYEAVKREATKERWKQNARARYQRIKTDPSIGKENGKTQELRALRRLEQELRAIRPLLVGRSDIAIADLLEEHDNVLSLRQQLMEQGILWT